MVDPPNGKLFRYLALTTERRQWVKDIFVKRELYLPYPTTFNDPFDCKVPPLEALPTKVRERFAAQWVQRELNPSHAMRDERQKRLYPPEPTLLIARDGFRKM
jgi:hypothetical protein